MLSKASGLPSREHKMVKMRLIAGAIKTIDVPFGNLIVNRAKIETTDYKSLYKVLDNLSLEGLVDAYPTGEDLFFKAAGNGTQELVNNQYSGKYSIELAGEQLTLCVVDDALEQRLSQALNDAALDLAFDQHRIDHRAEVVERRVF